MSEKKSSMKDNPRYYKNGANIYPYSGLSAFFYNTLKVDLWLLAILFVWGFILSLFSITFGNIGKYLSSHASTNQLVNQQQLKFQTTAFKLSNWAATRDLSQEFRFLLTGLLVLLVGYLITIALRHHENELRPHKDFMLAKKWQRNMKEYYHITGRDEFKNQLDNNKNEGKKISKNDPDELIQTALKQMKYCINTRKEVNGSDYMSIAKVEIVNPNKSTTKAKFDSLVKELPHILTTQLGNDFIFGEHLVAKDNKTYFFLAEKNVSEEYIAKLKAKAEKLEAKKQKVSEEDGDYTPEPPKEFTPEKALWPLDLLADRHEIIAASRKAAEDESQDTIAGMELYMQSNTEVSAQLDNVKITSTTTRFTYTIPKGKKISLGSLKEHLEAFIGIANILISTSAGKLVIDIPLSKPIMLDSKKIFSEAFFGKKLKPLEAIVGGDSDGNPVVYDFATAPHILVAGTTGSGKSVAINQFIASLIIHNTPEEVQFIIVDPKGNEFVDYENHPHLLCDPITKPEDMDKAILHATDEMDDRFKKLKEAKSKDIGSFNKKAIKNGTKKMPYLFIIVDEVSDMMMTAGKEVEDYILRIAQKARAAGIHILLATQTPRVDVITGKIKANIPSRISYAVTSSTESGIILDQTGAESLLGKGDSLVKWNGQNKPSRVSALFLDEEEIERISNYLKENVTPCEKVNIVAEAKRRHGLDDEPGNESDFMSSLGSGKIDMSALTDSMTDFETSDGDLSTSTKDDSLDYYKRASANIERLKMEGQKPLDEAATSNFFAELSASFAPPIEAIREQRKETDGTKVPIKTKVGNKSFEFSDQTHKSDNLSKKINYNSIYVTPEDIAPDEEPIAPIVTDNTASTTQQLEDSFDSLVAKQESILEKRPSKISRQTEEYQQKREDKKKQTTSLGSNRNRVVAKRGSRVVARPKGR